MAEPLYCVCRQPYDSLQFMIQCDSCEEWFHGSCIGIEEHQASDIERYHCPECAILHGPLTLKKRRNWHRHDYSEIDDGSKAVQAGTVAFIKELKSRRFKESNIVVKLDNGRHLTVEYLEKQGFNRPILVLNREGLGMVIPDKNFNVLDVERHVGSMRELDVIDVCRQEDYHMRMREWTDYYMNPIKKKILNVISLEFSNTSMSQLIHAPMVVREMDWAGHVWPSDLPEDSPHKKPLIQKYCLMGVKNSYTDFHVDFGGTSVWYHVLKGEKVFFFVEPTAENLTKYEKWVQSAHQSEMFFGDMVDHCFKCSVKPGQTLFIPSGWIHAVFTTVDSLVFGGNFLCTVNTELQLKVYGLERRLKTPDKFLHPCYETINWYAAVYLLDKIKAILEANNKPPDKLVQGMTALAAELKMWSTKGEEFTKQHKFFIPDSVSPTKLIKSINKELKKTEKSSKNSRPSTPKLDENEVKESSPVPPVFIDGTRPRLKIKTPKPEAPKNQRSKNTGDQLKNELEDKSVIRTVNAHLKEDLKRKSDTLSTSLPSLKLKIPRTQEPGTTDVEVHEGRTQLSASADSSSLKLLVSNGKIISNNNRSGRKITGKKFQPLLEQDGLGPSAVRDGSYSCSPSKQGPLRLKLSMNSMGNKSVSSLETHFTDSDTSDNELNFSVGGTPSLVPMQPRTTRGTIGTTRGLQATGSAPRPQQPVAGVDWASSTDQREEIEAANTLLFGLAAGGKVKKLRSFGYPAAAPTREPSSAQPSQPPIDPSASHLNSNPSASESESDGERSGEEDLGFGASDYFHDKKYVYPPLAEMDDDKVSSWKPGQRKKKSERVDSTWNPKSKLTYSPSKEIRPVRQNSRRNTATQPSGPGSLLNSPLEESTAVPGVFTFDGTSQETARESSKAGNNAVALNGSDASGVSESMSSDSKTDSNVKGQSKRGRHKTVTTTKQRLAKILKLDKTGRYMR